MKYRLDVEFKDKDKVKALGARWNPVQRYWYYEGELPEGLKKWYHEAVPQEQAKAATDYTDPEAGDIVIELRPAEDEKSPYLTVSKLNEMIAGVYETTPKFDTVMVKGEVTNFSGHKGKNYYFDIKDEFAVVSCIMWESRAEKILKFELKEGQKVGICGQIKYYEKGGKTQVEVYNIVNIGEGEMSLALMKLKAKLTAEGIFSDEFKKPIPTHPKAVGIITSKGGQAIQDICSVAKQRNPYVQLYLYHVNVQGRDAVETTVAGIKKLDSMGLDTLIVGRGGGSTEDLSAYNDEKVVRAIFAAKTPIVSAVGHAGNASLTDLAADDHFITPTEAAEKAIPDLMSDIRRLNQLEDIIRQQISLIVSTRRNRLDSSIKVLSAHDPDKLIAERREKLEKLQKDNGVLVSRKLDDRKSRLNNAVTVLKSRDPAVLIKERKEKVERLSEQIRNSVLKCFNDRKGRFDVILARLNGLSPTAKLVGGFGYIARDDKPVKSVEDVKPGDVINITLHDGSIEGEVKTVSK